MLAVPPPATDTVVGFNVAVRPAGGEAEKAMLAEMLLCMLIVSD